MVKKKVVATIQRTRRVTFGDLETYQGAPMEASGQLSRTLPLNVGSPPQDKDDGLVFSIKINAGIPITGKCTTGFGANSKVYMDGIEVKKIT